MAMHDHAPQRTTLFRETNIVGVRMESLPTLRVFSRPDSIGLPPFPVNTARTGRYALHKRRRSGKNS